MKHFILFLLGILFSASMNIFGQFTERTPFSQKLSIEWQEGKPAGTIEILNGRLSKIEIIKGKGKVKGNRFEIVSTGEARISLTIDSARINPGEKLTIITANTKENPFSFFLRDVSKEYPIYIADYKVVVCHNNDNRSFSQIEVDIKNRWLQTKLQKITNEPEESFEEAGKRGRNQTNPTLLGVSRDIRIFQISPNLVDAPKNYEIITALKPDRDYHYNLGRGGNSELNITRRLEDGVLPILHTILIDDDIKYHSISFVSFEHSLLSGNSTIGTDNLVADSYLFGTKLKQTDELIKSKVQEFLNQSEETVLFFRTYVTNTGSTPHYAMFQTATPGQELYVYASRAYAKDSSKTGDQIIKEWNLLNGYEEGTGFYSSDGSIAVISKLNGNPLPLENISVYLNPGETITFEFYIPHKPVSRERAIQLSKRSFDERYADCKKFWKEKLDKAAQIHVPEKRIEEMIKAGLLHLDLTTYGLDPEDPLATAVGVSYCPIGTESAPIIQFYNSIGLPDLAKRSLMHFFEKQRGDGFMQNYQYYMGETGAILWTAGEYYRYTNDIKWVQQIEPKLIKSCDYLLKWREKNKIESLRGKGYGMIEGSMADPVDPYRQFMLNGYAYLGLSRVSEMLSTVDPVQSARLKKEAEMWKQDIRETFFNSMGHSPVVPLDDGTWCPTVPPWPERVGPKTLFFGEDGYVADALLGPLYLTFCEVLEPGELASKMMLKYYSELYCKNNSPFSQPYYSRYDWLQLKLGLINPFLKTYYNIFPAHADRETYTFWEGYTHSANHKTHEEAWFLMQTRWMLYLEEGKTLKLLSGIPRKWMEDGKIIEVNNVSSYFGALSFKVSSHLDEGYIEATIDCNSDRKPESVAIRIPHPDTKKPVKVIGGIYDFNTETVTVKSFTGDAHVRVEY